MKQINCPNCGAPYEAELNKCPYCGTNYFDLSFIDFDATEPFYIKIKRTFKDKNRVYPGILTIKVLPEIMETQIQQEECYATGFGDIKLASFIETSNAFLNLGFRSIPNEKGELMRLEIKK